MWLSNTEFDLASDSVSGCSIPSDFGGASRALSLPRRIWKRSDHIKKLGRLAKRDDLDLWFEDECHFQQHGSRCTMWVPPENVDPIVLHAPTRKSIAIFGAVCSEDGRLVTRQAHKFAAESFLCFLRQLLRHRRHHRKMVLIADNARWHRAKALDSWLHEHRDVFTLEFLPPYSPELNSIERVWKLTRRICTHNRYFEHLEELTETVFAQFEAWRRPNQTLKKLCAIT